MANVGIKDARKKQAAYLEALEAAGGDVPKAMEEAGLDYRLLRLLRKEDALFAKKEKYLCKDPLLWMKTAYLEELRYCYGNRSKARKAVGVSKEDVEEWQEQDRKFMQRENAIYEEFVDLANEQNVRLMVGANCKVRDTNHLRWALAKVDSRWEDKPKVLEHRYGGSVTVKDTRDRLKELLRPEDVVDGDIIEGA